MVELKQADCPECQTTLRFRPTTADVVAINCPNCRHLFEVYLKAPAGRIQSPRLTPASTKSAEAKPRPQHSSPPPANSQQDSKTASESTRRKTFVKPILVEATSVENPTTATSDMVLARAVEAEPIDESEPVDVVHVAYDATAFDYVPDPVIPMVRPRTVAGKKADRQLGPRGVARNAPPTLGSASSKRDIKETGWKLPFLIGLTLTCLALLGICVLYANTKSGARFFSSISPFGKSPQNYAEKLNTLVSRASDVASKVQDEGGRGWGTDRLNEILEEMDQLVFDMAKLRSISPDEKKRLEDILNEPKADWIMFSRHSKDLEEGFPFHDRLVTNLRLTREGIVSARLLLTEVLVEPRNAETIPEKACVADIELERDVVRILATVEKAQDIGPTLDALRGLADRINAIAEVQFQVGPKIGEVSSDYAQIEVSGEFVREWFVDHLRRKYRPDLEFDNTIKDLEYVEDRFDCALMKREIAVLDSSSAERVAGGKAPEEILPPLSVRGDPFGDALPRDSLVATMIQADDSASIAQQRRSAEVAAEKDHRLAMNPNASESEWGEDDPLSGEDLNPFEVGELEEEQGNQPSIAVGRDKPTFGNGSGQLPSILPSPSQAVIVILEAGDAQHRNLLDRLATEIKAKISPVRSVRLGDEITLLYSYSGPIGELVRGLRYGEVVLTDVQSRTLYIVP